MPTATNPQTGEKLILQNGQWVPVGAATTGSPITLGHPDPYKARDQQLQEEEAARQRGIYPLETESKQANIKQSEKSLENTDFGNVNTLRTGFNALPEVKNYSEALTALGGMMRAPKGPQGDLAVIYGFAKAMDPGSVVRESEMGMAQSTASVVQQLQQKYKTFLEGKGLPEQVRTGLIEAARQKVAAFKPLYDQQYLRYAEQAKKNNFDPKDVVGDPLQRAVRPLEEEYIREHGGTPKIAGADSIIRDTNATEAGFDLKADPRVAELTPEQNSAYEAWWKANPEPTPEQLQAFFSTFKMNVPAKNAAEIIAAKKQGRGVSSGVEYVPDISDTRGQGGIGETADAAIRGAADVASFGLADKVAAVGDTITGGGTFDQNLARQYAISDYDTANHPIARIGGQVAGGFAVPLGEVTSLPQLAAKGAGIGAAYGAGSSRSLADVPQNAFLGGVAGAAIPTALVGAGRGIGAVARGLRRSPADVPPLVDPATGELNQPMDAMRPAQRVQTMKDYGLKTITPGMAGGRSARIGEQVLNNMPASAGHMEDVYSTAAGELRRSMQGEAQKFGTSKTLNEGGGEVQRGLNEWVGRAGEVDRKVYNAIPIAPESPTTNSSTIGFLQQNTSKFQSNPKLQEELKDPKLAEYLVAIQEHGLNWKDLKDFRSYIGAKAGQFRFSMDPLKEDYRGLYGALSEDMRASAAAQGSKALRAFERANSFHAAMENRIEGAIVRLLGKDAQARPELAAAAIQTMTQGGKVGGDIGKLAQIKASTVKSGAWDEIASTLIHLGGQPANSEGRAFEPATFVKWYADMSEDARRLLFKPELRKSLEGFVAMNQQLSRIKALSNNSNTGPLVLGGAQLLQFGKMIMSADLTGMAIQIGANAANYALGKFWTTPKAVSILTGYGRAAAAGNQGAMKSQIGRLTKLATTNPELRAPIQAMLAHLNDNAPAAGQIAASPDEGPQNQAQPY